MPNYTAIEYTTILTDFRRRLEVLVSYAERVGAMPVLILPPANDAGFEPNRSFLPPMTPRAERDAFARDFLAARQLETVESGGRDRALSRADRPPALFRGNSLPVGPSPRASRRAGMKPIGNTWRRATWTACRCVARAPSRRSTARWPRGMAAS